MYHLDAGLRAQLDALAAETKAVKAEARARAKEVSPIRVRLRRMNDQLKNARKRQLKMRTWNEWSDRDCELIHGQEWRELVAKIAQLESDISTAEIAILLHTTKPR